MEFPGLIGDFGHVQVTAFGGDPAACRTASWENDVVSVGCFDAAGSPVSTRFSALFLAPEPDALAGGGAALAHLALRRRAGRRSA